jgi:hypothetical protein
VSNALPLPALEGTNPLGFLAALGVLDALAARSPSVTLHWTDELVPTAIIGGFGGDMDDLLDALDRDRAAWQNSPLLAFPEGAPLSDAKPDEKKLRDWFEFVSGPNGSQESAYHLCSLVAEFALTRERNAKPTHFDFTAGNQHFLSIVRELISGVDRERIREAVCGPWQYDGTLKTLSWDSRGERVYALRGRDPSKAGDKRTVPGADWLAFRGLSFYPVKRTAAGSSYTTAGNARRGSDAMRWPLWSASATRNAIRSLVADSTLVSEGALVRPEHLAARGIFSLRQSSIRRDGASRYGSFGASEELIGISEV